MSVSPALAGEVKPKARRWSTCTRLLVAAAVTIGAIGLPSTYHSAEALMTGREHIGHGIHLDMKEVLATLTPAEKAVIDNRANDPKAVITLFTRKLSGDYGRWYFIPFAPSSNAVDYLEGHGKDRGVCRQKARILFAILNHLEIPAELEAGTRIDAPYRWHVWVSLPDLGIVADPTDGYLEDAEMYRARYSLYVEGVPVPSGWY